MLDIGSGWGSFINFAAENYGVECVGITISKEQVHYANNHRDNIKGIAFMEALIKPMTWGDFPPEYKIMLYFFPTYYKIRVN